MQIPGEYGSPEFEAAYQAARNGKPKRLTSPWGTYDWLMEQYRQTPTMADLSPVYRKNLLADMRRLSRLCGDLPVKDMRARHVERILGQMSDTPAAANKLLKLFRRLNKFAIRRDLIAADPAALVKGYKNKTSGYYTWTFEDIKAFEDHHGTGSRAVLALRLALYTGGARHDMAGFGWQNVSAGRFRYTRHKTKRAVDLPIHPKLQEAIDKADRSSLLFLGVEGRARSVAGLGNWFAAQRRAAGLANGSLHGLRKCGATLMAENGASDAVLAAYLGHSSTIEARTYRQAAEAAKLGDGAISRFAIPEKQ